jgi:hypothetical protein
MLVCSARAPFEGFCPIRKQLLAGVGLKLQAAIGNFVPGHKEDQRRDDGEAYARDGANHMTAVSSTILMRGCAPGLVLE